MSLTHTLQCIVCTIELKGEVKESNDLFNAQIFICNLISTLVHDIGTAHVRPLAAAFIASIHLLSTIAASRRYIEEVVS